ncbi:uncharacterized protein LOC114962686 [Acropora millepora]|uniref:uncharacterized protein LOC114962686 n=1 Tax=Acropora millepora TaxID=45264 RepID=UPI001CF14B3D|nr:uncharacterized protein LOC114962686 [Acropora millepora]
MDSRPLSFDMDIHELLIHIVQAEGGKVRLDILEEVFKGRTGFALSSLKSPKGRSITSTSSNQQGMVDYLQTILLDEGPLELSTADSCIYLHYEEAPLDCSTESEMSLSEVITKLKVSGEITQLDLSRRCFSSPKKLLEVCKSAKLLRKLIVRDICFANDANESGNLGISLMEHIKWYCPSLKEIDVTGCSDVTRGILLEPEDVLQEHGIPVERAIDFKIIDLLEEHHNIKDILTPLHFSTDLSAVRGRIEKFVTEGGPVNISHDGWTFVHTASAIGDEGLISWLLNTGGNSKFQSEGSRKPSALDIAVYRHDVRVFKLLLDAQKTSEYDPSRFVKMWFRSSDVSNLLRHVDEASAPNPLDVVTYFMKSTSLEIKKKLLIEIFKTLERSFHDVKEMIPTVEDILAELLEKLMAMGCSPDISIPELEDKTLLMCAVSSPVLVNTLLDLGASTCIKDAEGNTALFFAARETVRGTVESLEALHRLITSCKEVDKCNNYGETPLLYTVSTQGFKGHGTLLSQFSRGSYVKTWEVLVDAGAQIDARNHESESILHLILQLIKYLVHDPQTSQEEAQIRHAIEESIRMVEFICHKDSKLLNSRDRVGNTALHNFVGYSSIHVEKMVQIAQVLIDCGSVVNALNDDGQTPLHLAKLWNMAELLLQQGGEANAQDYQWRSPLLYRCIQEASNEEPLDMVGWLAYGLNYGMDPWLEDKEGLSVFEVLMQHGKCGALHSLISASIAKDTETVFKKDQNGNTLLHKLCNYHLSQQKHCFCLLLQEGADTNASNEDGDTPLHIVCRKINRLSPQREGYYRKYISLLRAYGANYRLKNKSNFSVLELVYLKKNLLSFVKRPRKQRESKPFFKWSRRSEAHVQKLSQVVRRRNADNIDEFFYHKVPIGSGSFGSVFAAINSEDGKEVALKRVERLRLQTRRVNREVQTLIQLSSCPHVVTYLRFIEGPDFTWIALELMEGHLGDLLRLQLEAERFPCLCKDVLQGVQYLHENNFVHRDLKPSNILFHSDQGIPRLKISDFGLSKNLGAVTSSGSSVYHSNAGSRCWMAPELLQSSRPEHTFCSDWFAVGLIFHYLLTDGRHPFEGSDDGCGAVEKNILTDSKFLCDDLCEEAKELILELIAAKEDDRPSATDALRHPYFWSDDKKVKFLKAVANQTEIATYNPRLHGPVIPIVHQIESSLSPLSDWSGLFPALYCEMTSSPGFRTYVTSSAVHLLRFIRNAYAHVSDSKRTKGFQAALLNDYTFFRELPKLLVTVHNAVKSEKWETRAEISNVLNSVD